MPYPLFDELIHERTRLQLCGLLAAVVQAEFATLRGSLGVRAVSYTHLVTLPEVDLGDEPVVVVVGSEGKGLSRLVRETCDRVVSIPMASTVESLNAGVAASVALYEIARQRAATPRRSR